MPLALSRYAVEAEPFAFGGMGEIYRATDLLLNAGCVIKTIRRSILSGASEDDQKKFFQQFFREAAASARLSLMSENVVKVTNFGIEGGVPFLAAEYMEGGSVQSLVGNVTPAEATLVFKHVCSAIEIAHKNKIVHSDLSPDNILSNKEHTIYKVSDFGLLRVLESILISRGATLIRGGKVRFMPVAHLYDHTKINESTDTYALSVILYLLFTGEFPPVTDVSAAPTVQQIKIKRTGKFLKPAVAEILNNGLALKLDVAGFRKVLELL